jgi:hypothetical protein
MPQAKILPLRSIAELKVLVQKAWEDGDHQARRLQDARLVVAHLLLELREAVEAEGGDWWPWCRDNLADRGRRDIERLLAIAKAPHPAAALEAERAKARTGMARLRDARAEVLATHLVAKPAAPPKLQPVELGPISNERIQEIVDLFVSLHQDEQDETMNRLIQIMSKQGVQYF